MTDICQALAGLQIFAGGEKLQVQRDIVGQLLDADGETGLFVLRHHVDHGLATIARLAVHMLEQQQRQRTTATEQRTVVLLAVHQVVVADQCQQFLQRAALLRADFPRGVDGQGQLGPALQQLLGRVVQEQ
ncbi:hypothetical protein D3C71_1716080 [compost metagenome]